jgi:hypothetical protein
MPITDALQATLDTIPKDADPKLYGHAWGLMHGYDAVYREQAMRASAIEQQFVVPIYNLGGERLSKSRTLELGGVMDKLVMDDGKKFVMDHKTTSDDLGPESSYWQQLVVEGQASLYTLACHLQGIEVAGAIWDVIRKPGIKPKALSKAVQASITCEPHTYFGFTVSKECIFYVIEGMNVEDSELFAYRCARECLDDPSRYFARRKVLKLESEIREFANELWDVSQDIIQVRRTERHYRNSGACRLYNRPCEYLGICSGFDRPDSAKWQRRQQVHSELSLDGDGRDVLTHTRMRTFQTCRKKHYLRYELGIERVQEEEAEALYFGKMIHTALNAWWGHYLERESDGDGSSTAASEKNV